MFRRIFELWNKDDLLRQAFKDTSDMLKLAEDLFCKAAAPLLHGTTADKQSIYNADQRINIFQIETRKKVLEHLAISPQQDTTAALVLITIAIDIERLGDYSKNFFELWELYGSRLNYAPVIEDLREINVKVVQMFDDAIVAFEKADTELARKIMDTHMENAKSCEGIIAKMIQLDECDNAITCNQRVLVALAARYLKRVSAHLKNIASSVVNPFDRIGFKPPEEDEKVIGEYE